MPRKSKLSVVPIVRRKGRKLIGVSEEQYKQIVRLRKTRVGMLSVAAVTATLINLGLEHLGPVGIDVREETE